MELSRYIVVAPGGNVTAQPAKDYTPELNLIIENIQALKDVLNATSTLPGGTVNLAPLMEQIQAIQSLLTENALTANQMRQSTNQNLTQLNRLAEQLNTTLSLVPQELKDKMDELNTKHLNKLDEQQIALFGKFSEILTALEVNKDFLVDEFNETQVILRDTQELTRSIDQNLKTTYTDLERVEQHFDLRGAPYRVIVPAKALEVEYTAMTVLPNGELVPLIDAEIEYKVSKGNKIFNYFKNGEFKSPFRTLAGNRQVQYKAHTFEFPTAYDKIVVISAQYLPEDDPGEFIVEREDEEELFPESPELDMEPNRGQ